MPVLFSSGSKLPNGWGLFDVHGNVWEWCQDLDTAYDSEAALSEPIGRQEIEDGMRLLRGGSFNLNAPYVRSAYRSLFNPVDRLFNIGFRVARTCP
jgi:formylglycine-generating enzyme required for sulfatase activity